MSELRKFNEECLAAHNGLRNAHNVKPLKYDEKLAIAAQQYAEKLAKQKVLEHSKDTERPGNGENLAFSFRPFVNFKYSGRGATSSWYSEIKDYDFSKEQQKPGNPPTGHFTQVIWKDCKSAGFGRAQSSDMSWYVVGRYAPSGNFIGNYMNNVPRGSLPKWEDNPVIKEYLEELRTWEFTKTRKHILDDWTSETKGTIKGGVKSFTITENFDSKIYGKYSGTATFSEDPSDLPRPEFVGNESNNFDDGDESSDDNTPTEDLMDFEEESFENSVLRQHNFYRKKHNAQPLKIDKKLSEYAEDWAKAMAENKKTDISGYRHNNSEIGENISMKSDQLTSKSGERLVDNWYQEEKLYTYNREPNNFPKVGHFTQVVWKETNSIGIGYAKDSSRNSYIACFYYPAGNVKNNFTKNVLPPSN